MRRGTLAAALAPLGLAATLAGAPAGAQEAPPTVGSYAPGFELPDCKGELRRLAWVEGGPAVTIVFFFDPQTKESLLEMSFLDALHDRARDFGLAVFAVEAGGRQPAEVNRALERYCAVYGTPDFAILPDPARRTGRVYGVRRVPTTFVTESHGVIISRTEGFGPEVAVDVARRVERLLRRERGAFSEAVRSAGVSPTEEGAIEERLAAALEVGRQDTKRSLIAGDRAPELSFADLSGRARRWEWGTGGGGAARILYFWGAGSIPSIEGLTWLDALARRGREVGLETVAVEAGGGDPVAVAEAMERYRRFNPPPVFPVVADPGRGLVDRFGPFERLPQMYLVALDGAILHRMEGFDADEAALLAGKVERAFLLAGRPFPEAPPAGAEGAPLPAGGGEAPSIREERERRERFDKAIVQGDAYFMSWQFDRALPYYLQAIEVAPRDLHALVRAAQSADRVGDRPQARALWERVLSVRPEHGEALERLEQLRRP